MSYLDRSDDYIIKATKNLTDSLSAAEKKQYLEVIEPLREQVKSLTSNGVAKVSEIDNAIQAVTNGQSDNFRYAIGHTLELTDESASKLIEHVRTPVSIPKTEDPIKPPLSTPEAEAAKAAAGNPPPAPEATHPETPTPNTHTKENWVRRTARAALKQVHENKAASIAIPAVVLAGGFMLPNKDKEVPDTQDPAQTRTVKVMGTGKKTLLFGSGAVTLGTVLNAVPGKTQDWIGKLAGEAVKAAEHGRV